MPLDAGSRPLDHGDHLRSAKRAETLTDRGLDFRTAAEVFEGGTLDIADVRRDYGEDRIISVGFLRGRMVVVVWTARTKRVTSFR